MGDFIVLAPDFFGQPIARLEENSDICSHSSAENSWNSTVRSEMTSHFEPAQRRKVYTVEPPCATTSRKRPTPISDCLSKTAKLSQSKTYSWNL